MSKTPENVFKKNLGHKQQLGIWSTLGAASVAELLLNCGFDWVLIDTEHSPNELPGVIEHLRVAQAAGVPAVVRPPWNDPVLVKRLMDQGAQSLLFPYVQNASEAAAAVSSTRFPPHGNRGVSGNSRGAGYGIWPDYFKRYVDEVCVIVQIETVEGSISSRRSPRSPASMRCSLDRPISPQPWVISAMPSIPLCRVQSIALSLASRR